MTTPHIQNPSSLFSGAEAIFSNSFAHGKRIPNQTSQRKQTSSGTIPQGPFAGIRAMHTKYSSLDLDSSQMDWQGGSGKSYAMEKVSVDDFILEETHLYMLVAKDSVVWIGTSRDLIDDSASRIQFRQNSKFATSAYSILLPHIEEDKIHLVADLASGHASINRHAA